MELIYSEALVREVNDELKIHAQAGFPPIPSIFAMAT